MKARPFKDAPKHLTSPAFRWEAVEIKADCVWLDTPLTTDRKPAGSLLPSLVPHIFLWRKAKLFKA